MKAVFLILAALVLSACQSAGGTKIETVEVKVPVSVPCIKEKPAAPAYQYGSGPYPGDEAAAVMMASDLESAKQYGRAWEAATVGCVMPAKAKAGK